jgi:hypothetical protein
MVEPILIVFRHMVTEESPHVLKYLELVRILGPQILLGKL